MVKKDDSVKTGNRDVEEGRPTLSSGSLRANYENVLTNQTSVYFEFLIYKHHHYLGHFNMKDGIL